MRRLSLASLGVVAWALLGAATVLSAPLDWIGNVPTSRFIINGSFGRIALDDGDNFYLPGRSFSGYVSKYSSDGSRLFSRNMEWPTDVATDPTGFLVLEAKPPGSYGRTDIQTFDRSGNPVRVFGAFGCDVGQLCWPSAIDVDGSGDIYVMERSRFQVFDSAGNYKRGSKDLSYWGCDFWNDIALDGSGNVHALNSECGQIRVLDASGQTDLRTFGGPGTGDGQLDHPASIALDASDHVYVADSRNHRIQVFDSQGNYLRKFGSFGNGPGQFRLPQGIDLDSQGNIWVTDYGNTRIQVFNNAGEFLVSSDHSYVRPYRPTDVAVDAQGTTYIAEQIYHRILVYDSQGYYLRTIGSSGTGDGQFLSPGGIAVDADGNLYVADSGNKRIQVFDPGGNFLRKITGGSFGSFIKPNDVAVAPNGNIYVADGLSFPLPRVVGFDGAGNQVFYLSGVLSYGVHVDRDGYLYVVNCNNGTLLKYNSQGTLVALKVIFRYAKGVVVDRTGNIFVADTSNHRVLVYDRDMTLIGTVYGQDLNEDYKLYMPYGVATNARGDLYVTNTYRSGLVQVYAGIFQDLVPPVIGGLSVAPNPVAVYTPVQVTATVDDSASGGSRISSADCVLDGVPIPMAASDGAFDGQVEGVECSLAAFMSAGVREVCVEGSDERGNASPRQCTLLAVYDASAGFVTGGGWIDSPAGAYSADPGLAGKANFGFVAKYQQGANTPVGETEFRFNVASFSFHSDSYDWLVVAGAKAQFKGVGTVNGQVGCGFMLTALDEALSESALVDRFRIKIWDRATNEVLYDNELGADDAGPPSTSLSGGSIVIHR